MNTQAKAQQVLQSTFGYASFRGLQADVVQHICDGGSALVLMPTGGGKSLCYQVPALVREGLTVVVSPLIALMQDQVQNLQQNGVAAAFVNSSLSTQEVQTVLDKVRRGQLKLLYMAPERLLMPSMLSLLDSVDIGLFAIDEAHCVSQWGHDFRPEYAQLSLLAEQYPDVPRLALTATADDQTRADIKSRLQLHEHAEFVASFDRPNIQYHIQTRNKGVEQLLNFIQENHTGETGIVYCLSRRKVEETAVKLANAGLNALPYHAGMESEIRAIYLRRFLHEDPIIIVATIAFGMGIDRPDVRFVAHLDLPKSIEAYYQETGRAGRDGLPSTVWMGYGLQDAITLRQMMENSGNGEQRLVDHHKLEAMLGLCEITRCRRQALLAYFGETLEEPCGNCDNCLEPPQTWDGTQAAQKALSCVYRTGQRFGVNYLISVLRGADEARIKHNNHHQQSTFGLGKDTHETTWRSVFRQLIAHGYLRADAAHGGLHLTEQARPLLRGEQSLSLRLDAKKSKAEKKRKRSSVALEGIEEDMWEELRLLRKELAEEQGVPPFMVFHDATLAEMAREQPKSLAEMAEISGVGASKLERFGEDFVHFFTVYQTSS
ncbi:MAG: DNA helicase RecQ [Granulosicoccaceae bacterium]